MQLLITAGADVDIATTVRYLMRLRGRRKERQKKIIEGRKWEGRGRVSE